MFGAHLSISGGLHNALIEAKELDMDCVQIFTKNVRSWYVDSLSDEQIDLWREHRKNTGIDVVVAHDSYLINLASPEDSLIKKSIKMFITEIERCEQLNIPYLVMHPGAHVGSGEEAGLKRIAESINEIHEALPGYKTVTCLEICAGQGTTLGYRFEHLRTIMDMVREPNRLAACFDTAHAFAAGYDLSSEKSTQNVLAEFDDVIGLEQLKVIHLNDSKVECGSRVDRHEHIGRGYIGLDAFRAIVNHERFRNVPKIIETKKGGNGEGRLWDAVNIETLRGLVVDC